MQAEAHPSISHPLDFYYAIEIKQRIDNGQSAEYASQLVQGKVPCDHLAVL